MRQRAFQAPGLSVIGALALLEFAESLLGAGFPSAANPPSTYVVIAGSNTDVANGDFVSTSTSGGGLGGTYFYRIEVTPGLSRLDVDIWDADIGKGADEQAVPGDRDERGGAAWESHFLYSLYRPDNTLVSEFDAWDLDITYDNVWRTLWSIANPATGHWSLRVRAVNSGLTDNDFNGFAIRAHDGTSGSGGRELNVYTEGIQSLGTNRLALADYTLHPYVVSGCSCSSNDFDSDDDPLSSGYTLRSRTGDASFGPLTPSGSTVWLANAVQG